MKDFQSVDHTQCLNAAFHSAGESYLRAFQKLVDRFLDHLFDGKPLFSSDDFQLLQGPLGKR
jgi:hypothetical protein